MSEEIETSVIICAYTMKRWDDICAAIASLARDGNRPDEIILVSDHNPELLEKAAAAFPSVTVIPNAEAQGLSGARNCGIREAKGRFVAFLDDDAEAEPGWLATMLGHFADPSVIGVTSKVLPHWIGQKPAWFPPEFLWTVGCSHPHLPDEAIQIRNVLGASMCMRRDAFEQVGGFTAKLGRTGSSLPISCEETEWCLRASREIPGGIFIYEPKAAIRHRVPAERLTWSYLVKRCFAEGISKARLAELAGASRSLSTEKDYVRKTLVAAAKKNLADTFGRGDPAGVARFAASLAGFTSAAAGYVLSRGRTMPNAS